MPKGHRFQIQKAILRRENAFHCGGGRSVGCNTRSAAKYPAYELDQRTSTVAASCPDLPITLAPEEKHTNISSNTFASIRHKNEINTT